MIDFYQKLPDIVLNGATEADKVLEEKAHLDFTKGLIDFLGRQGIDTLVWENFTEADLLGYDKAIEIHQAFWQWQLENYSKTGEYQMSSIDTWLDRQMETNIKNYLVSYVDSQGKLNYGIQSDYGPSIEILLNLGNGDINKGLDEWIRQDSNLHSITIPLFGQEALVPTALRGTATGVAFAFQKNPVFPSGSMMSAKVGFITPDGRWVFLPVNIPLNRIPATSQDLIVRNGHEVTPFDEGWVLGPAGESEDGRPSRIDFDKPEDLYRYLGHVIKIFMRNLIRSTDNSSFSSAGGVISRDGMNIVEGIGDLGLTPELSLPLSPLPTSIPATLSPPKIITPSPKDT